MSIVVRRGDEILVVQEAKAESRDRWNLPGGHVEHGESLLDAAKRELREEAMLDLPMTHIVGVYMRPQAIRIAFAASPTDQQPQAGDEVLDARFMPIRTIEAMQDQQLVAPAVLRTILRDVCKDIRYPLELQSTCF